jgi:hypothetical protein
MHLRATHHCDLQGADARGHAIAASSAMLTFLALIFAHIHLGTGVDNGANLLLPPRRQVPLRLQPGGPHAQPKLAALTLAADA